MAFTTTPSIVIEADTILTSENLESIGGSPVTLGQKTMANSLPVVIASDQSAIPITAASLPLPTGASTAAKQDTGNTSLASIDSKLTSPLAVTGSFLTDTQLRASPVPVSGTVAVSNFPATQNVAVTSSVEIEIKNDSGNPIPVSGTVSVGNFPAIQTIAISQTGTNNDVDANVTNGAGAAAVNIQDGGNSITVDGTVSISGSVAVTGPLTDAQLRATPVPISGTITANLGTIDGAATETTLAAIKTDADKFTFTATRLLVDGSGVTQPISGTVTANQGTSPWVVSGTVTTSPTKSATATRTTVARSNANQTLLASNASRLGATIFNDAAANLYVKFGTTATSADFTIRLQSQDYYEVPFLYTGRIDGIWASNGAGNALMTELT